MRKAIREGVYLTSERHFDFSENRAKPTSVAAFFVTAGAEKGQKTLVYSLGNKEKTQEFVAGLTDDLSACKSFGMGGSNWLDSVRQSSDIAESPVRINHSARNAQDVVADFATHGEGCGFVVVVNDGNEPTEDTMEISYQLSRISDAVMFAV